MIRLSGKQTININYYTILQTVLPMRKIFYTTILCFASLGINAQSQMVLNATDGTKIATSLQKKPIVTLSANGKMFTVKYGASETMIDMSNIEFNNASPNERIIVNCGGNQVMLPLSKIKKIFAEAYNEDNNNHLAKVIATNPDVSIYSQAIQATGLADTLKHYIDVTYSISPDSTNYNNESLFVTIGYSGIINVAYPKERKYNYTALLVTDDILAKKYGITSLEQLEKKAHEIYDEMYPEDKLVNDRTNRRNALNRFISYHILPFAAEYYNLTAVDGETSTLASQFDRDNIDITEWFETLMPNSIIKFSFPSGTDEGLYVNRRGVQARPDSHNIFVKGAKLSSPDKITDNAAINGLYHYIDDIISYGKTTQQIICNDRIRITAQTLSPDFIRSGARGHQCNDKHYYYSNYSQIPTGSGIGFKSGYTDNFTFDDSNTHIHVSSREPKQWYYQGETIRLKGKYDASIKLPTLPAGEYELRIGTTTGFSATGNVRLTIENQFDKTIDLSIGATDLGFLEDNVLVNDFKKSVYADYNITLPANKEKFTEKELTPKVAAIYPCNCTETITDEEGNTTTVSYYSPAKAFDTKWKEEQGVMKDPASFYPNTNSMRNLPAPIRHIVGTFTSDGKSDIKIRIKDENPHGGDFSLEFIEIVPANFENEDIY